MISNMQQNLIYIVISHKQHCRELLHPYDSSQAQYKLTDDPSTSLIWDSRYDKHINKIGKDKINEHSEKILGAAGWKKSDSRIHT
jgi:hypothetical protein